MKFIRALILCILPSFLSVPLLRLFGCRIKGKVGFSWLYVDKLVIENAYIKHFNLISVPSLHMHDGSGIKYFNRLSGSFEIVLRERSIINQFNKITGKDTARLTCGKNVIIGVNHFLDLTSSITIGNHSILAGLGSQVWTHGFYHSKFPPKRWRVDGDVIIGKNVYIGARCILNPGITICDNATIGAGAVVSKDISVAGLYVNQPLRLIEFDPDVEILKHVKVNDNVYKKK
jgi:acetyltransferase-like isoleucine patch superfamily enzyme